ncbi:hypothetical protein [uncultured Acetobacterium sp.]|uniref:hypothetical protein n=1 Tax=uncultured Acetobacterium sp. TaxID=217139 RepID=UPI0025DF6D9B|nr:hypothetical protein [uncultured Acetobacterium sp.]
MVKAVFRWWLLLLLLLAGGAIVAGLLIGVAEVRGIGLGFFVLLLLFVPVLAIQAKRLGRYDEDQVLVDWTYSRPEARQVARDVLAWQRQRNRWLAPFTAGCLAVIGAIFAVILHLEFPGRPLWQGLLLLLPVGLPWLVRSLYHLYLKRRILRMPCQSKIGRNFLIWGNLCPVFNERDTLAAVAAVLCTENDQHYLKLHYHSSVRMRYGKAEFDDQVGLLVPAGRDSEARALIKTLQDEKTRG